MSKLPVHVPWEIIFHRSGPAMTEPLVPVAFRDTVCAGIGWFNCIQFPTCPEENTPEEAVSVTLPVVALGVIFTPLGIVVGSKYPGEGTNSVSVQLVSLTLVSTCTG